MATVATLSIEAVLNSRRIERELGFLGRGRTINFNIGGGASQTLGRMAKSADQFEESLAAANSRVLAFGLSVGILTTFSRGLTETVKASREVEKALTDINTILNTSTKGITKFGVDLFRVANQTGQSFQVAAEAATEFARQGLPIEETLKRTKDALTLLKLSGGDVKGTVDSLTATINSFTKSALDSTDVVNKLAAVDAAFAISADDLAEAIKRTGSVAEDTGASFEELIALTAAVREITGRSGAVIGNSFKTLFQRVQNPAVLDQLKKFGVEIRNSKDEVLPSIQIFQNLGKQFDNLSGEAQNFVVKLGAGVFQSNVFRAILSDLAGGDLSKFSRGLKIAGEASDDAQKRLNKLNETFDALVIRTGNSLKQFGATIGQVGLEGFKPILESISTSLTGFSEDAIKESGRKFSTNFGLGIVEGFSKFFTGPGGAALSIILGKLLVDLVKFIPRALERVLAVNRDIQSTMSIQNGLIDQRVLAYQGLNRATQLQLTSELRTLDALREQNELRQRVLVGGFRPGEITPNIPFVRRGPGPFPAGRNSLAGLPVNSVNRLNAEIERLTLIATQAGANFGSINASLARTGRNLGLNNIQVRELLATFQRSVREQQAFNAIQAEINVLQRQSLGLFRGRAARARLEQLAAGGSLQAAGVLSNTNQAIQSRVQNITLGAAIIAPIIESTLSRMSFDESLGGRQNRSVATATGQTISGAATGALLGSITPLGPLGGAIAGGAIFGITSIIDAIKNWNDVLPDLQRNLENIVKSTSDTDSFFQQLINITQALSNPNLKQEDRVRLQEQITTLSLNPLFNSIADKFIKSGGNIETLIRERELAANRSRSRENIAGLEAFIQDKFIKNPTTEEKFKFDPQQLVTFTGTETAIRPGATEDIAELFKQLIPLGLDKVLQDNKSREEFISFLEKSFTLQGKTSELSKKFADEFANFFINVGEKDVAEIVRQRFSKVPNPVDLSGLLRANIPGSSLEERGQPTTTQTQNRASEFTAAISTVVQNIDDSFFQLSTILPKLIDDIQNFNTSIINSISVKEQELKFENDILKIRAEGDIKRRERFLSPLEAANIRGQQTTENITRSFGERRFGLIRGLAQQTGSTGLDIFNKIETQLAKEQRENTPNQLEVVKELQRINVAFRDLINEAIQKGGVNPLTSNILEAQITEALKTPFVKDEPELQTTLRQANQILKDFKGQSFLLDQEQKLKLEEATEILRQIELDINQFSRENATADFRAGRISGQDLAGILQERRLEDIRTGKFEPGAGAQEAFLSQFAFNNKDLYREINDGAIETALTIKSSFKDAVNSVIEGTSSIEDAFRNMLLSITTQILEKTTSIGIDKLLGSVVSGLGYNRGGMVKRYSSGGLVTGGSGVRDDVPAMLTGGEYVITNRAVDKYGSSFFNNLSSGVNVGLVNRFDYNGTRPTSGRNVIDPNLSSIALEDENNPQNAIRRQREDTFFNYLRELEAYNQQKEAAFDAFRRQKQGVLISSYVGAATNIAGGYLGGSGGITRSGTYRQNTFNFANGGSVFGGSSPRDNVPAMLTGGEYVVRKEVVDKYGQAFFDRINALQYANGGYVPGGTGLGSANTIDTLSKSIDELRNAILGGNRNAGNTNNSDGLTIYTTTNVTINENGQVTSSNNSTTTNSKENQEQKQKQLQELSKMMESVAIKTIVDQKRPNKLLDFRNVR